MSELHRSFAQMRGAVFRFLRWLLGLDQTNVPTTKNDSAEVMNEGDFHSGPAGYSANTSYSETEYRSGS